jgi:hypothetical protein
MNKILRIKRSLKTVMLKIQFCQKKESEKRKLLKKVMGQCVNRKNVIFNEFGIKLLFY